MMSNALLTKTFFDYSVVGRKVFVRVTAALSFIPNGLMSASRFAGTDLNSY
jgi:hypothetical protein